MNHELVHIRQKHWLDLLLVEMLCMIQWFNPVVWIYVRFIRQNHEYLADEVALQRTSDPAIYRAALLNQIVGAPVVSLANSFNYSLNKKRFNMMKNIIKSPYRKMKVLLILPVFAIVLYSFAKPDYKYLNEKTGNSNVTLSPLQQEVKGIIVQKDGEPLPGAIVTLKGTTLGTVAGDNGSFKIGPVPDDGILIVSFVGFKSKALKPVFTSDMRIEMMRDTIKYSGMTFTTPPPPPPPPPTPVALPEVAPPPPPPPPPSDKTNKAPFVAVETLPEFPGGKDALAAWISSNLKYPGDAYKNKISGEVLVSFLVTNTGTVKDVTVIKSASPLLNEEAIRVISSMPDWKPATQHQKKVGVNMQVPVEFNLK
jgi:TonB family protein